MRLCRMGRFSLFQKGICRLRGGKPCGALGDKKTAPQKPAGRRRGGDSVDDDKAADALVAYGSLQDGLTLRDGCDQPVGVHGAILVSSMVQVTVCSVPSTRIWTVEPTLAENSLMVSPLF